ncbi:MAG TPA: hypothetical protein VFE60_16815 [Roseiarcus sp.]|jgi:hypothetical protein|nr:hypothetical protein [Roseiarcus sp.]
MPISTDTTTLLDSLAKVGNRSELEAWERENANDFARLPEAGRIAVREVFQDAQRHIRIGGYAEISASAQDAPKGDVDRLDRKCPLHVDSSHPVCATAAIL